jgi:DNA-binding SARP family transcriptional activator
MSDAIEQILGSGAYAAAEELSLAITGGLKGHAGLVLRSRLAQQKAARDEGLILAEEAWAAAPASLIGLLNLVSARHLAGDIDGAVTAGRLLERSGGSDISRIGGVFRRVLETSLTGDLQEVHADLIDLVEGRRHGAERHFAGVGLLNLAYVALPMGHPSHALQAADEAIALLGASAGVDVVAARLAKGAALAYMGRMEEARAEFAASEATVAPGQYPELVHEIAQIEALLGESDRAWRLVKSVEPILDPSRDISEQTVYVRAILHARDGSLAAAAADVQLLTHGALRSTPGFEAQRHLAKGLVYMLAGSPQAFDPIGLGTRIAREQSAALWAEYGALLLALADRAKDPSAALLLATERMPVVASMLAEPIATRLNELSTDARNAVVAEAERRPWRWRGAARHQLRSRNAAERERAAELLEVVGDSTDVRLLSEIGRKERRVDLARHGRMLARRLSSRVFVEDLGRVRIYVGDRSIDSSEVRRRVLALLCLLLTRPKYSSTREEVIDSLWPDHDPGSALNSLNQTAYFLRRVFEPEYREDTSPGYLGQDAETIWLDQDLVECRSRRCIEIIRSMPGEPTPEGALALAREYEGRFALDFAYDDWTTDYRDGLHAAYLRVMEQAIRMDLNSGQVARGTFLAERALDVDHESEEIQIALIRLYRVSGAHAAAAEKYAQYARSVRDLGVEPIPLNDL